MFKVGVLIRSRFLPYKNCSTMDALHEVYENDRLSYFCFSKALTQSSSSHLSTDLTESGHSNICRLVVFSIFLGAIITCYYILNLLPTAVAFAWCPDSFHFESFPGVLMLFLRLGHYVAEVCLELLIFLPTPLMYWGYRLALSFSLGFFLFVCFHSYTIPKTSQS